MQNESKICLPQYYLITGKDPKNTSAFLSTLEKCLQSGISLVQLRAKDLTSTQYEFLAKETIVLCHSYKVKILLNNNISLTQELGADGVHLTSASLLKNKVRPLNKEFIVAASCHNKNELLHAKRLNIDFVTLSPVLPTTSHPGTISLGWKQFKSLLELINIPIFALGGLKKADLNLAIECGAYGIAAIGALWNIE
ncbi:MAG TPA: thiamine phosphate synthase [Burkholderiales bacterium]|nr:thiamine phosphate synthase [Burkholderiales bacterium]